MTVSQALRTSKRSTALLNLVVGSLVAVAAASAQADTVIYNNLGATSTGVDQIQISSYDFDSFTPTANETLSAVELALGSYSQTGGTGTLDVGLYSLSNLGIATPTLITSLGTINNSQIIGGIKDYAVTMTSDPTLTAGTRYWIGVSDFDDGAITWSFSSDISGIGQAGEYWAGNGGNVSPNTTRGPFQMELTVPDEAQPASLLALGVAGVAFLAWKTDDRRRWVTVASNRRPAP